MINPLIVETLDRYRRDGIPTGSFLRAVLANDLYYACAKADIYNRNSIVDIAEYIIINLDTSIYGSYHKIDNHIMAKKKGENNE